MSLERIQRALKNLGLTNIEAEIYVHIARNGPQTVIELDNALNYSKNQIYRSLKTITAKKLINKTEKTYSALPFEEGLDLLIKMKKEQTESLSKNKKELLVDWKKEE